MPAGSNQANFFSAQAIQLATLTNKTMNTKPLTLTEAEHFIGAPLENATFASALQIGNHVVIQNKPHADYESTYLFEVYCDWGIVRHLSDEVGDAVNWCMKNTLCK